MRAMRSIQLFPYNGLTLNCYHLNNASLCKVGMCNSDGVLDYSAVTAMIDHENYNRGETKF